MLHVTDRAIDKLQELREGEGSPPGMGIALIPQAEGTLNLVMTEPSQDDQVIERGGEPIVIVPAVVGQYLDGWSLDYGDAAGEEQLILAPPEELLPG